MYQDQVDAPNHRSQWHPSPELKPLVMKFGGTSVANLERIERLALRALDVQRSGFSPIIVVSAMAGVTDQLLKQGRALGGTEGDADLDALLASGEQVTASLTALAIKNLGGRARSFLGWQLNILTEGPHSEARVTSIDPSALFRAMARQEIPVTAGFQGISRNRRITTLGRGGSDTSAVAIAAAVGAELCEIFTDVDGVYAADPNHIAKASRYDVISYEHMLSLASRGAKVLHPRSVALAKEHGITMTVRSSFHAHRGTTVTAARRIKDAVSTAVTMDRNVVLARVSTGVGQSWDTLIKKSEFERLQRSFAEKGWLVAAIGEHVAVSLVGVLAQDPSLPAQLLDLLIRHNIAVAAQHLSEQTITHLVAETDARLALELLHQNYVTLEGAPDDATRC